MAASGERTILGPCASMSMSGHMASGGSDATLGELTILWPAGHMAIGGPDGDIGPYGNVGRVNNSRAMC